MVFSALPRREAAVTPCGVRVNGRAELIAYLRWLADQPDGVAHRDVLFRAALLLDRDSTAVFMVVTEQERHGDQST